MVRASAAMWDALRRRRSGAGLPVRRSFCLQRRVTCGLGPCTCARLAARELLHEGAGSASSRAAEIPVRPSPPVRIIYVSVRSDKHFCAVRVRCPHATGRLAGRLIGQVDKTHPLDCFVIAKLLLFILPFWISKGKPAVRATGRPVCVKK